MNGSLFYGNIGRIISGISYVTMIIVSMQVGGMMNFLPPKAAAVLLALGATLTAFSERLTGGASSPQVRAAAAASDTKNANEASNG